ncbi:putative RNA methyltransferase [Aestuariibacter salexigens]|uniref:putative RNA methyltransferase n=1 Tax=Aestuariibacter salexigens TaxID=226010 RepID=UPI000426A4CC|nr:methyltransferase domain-containing protein [Aestuariibacter salexigens]
MKIVPFEKFACPLDALPLQQHHNRFTCSDGHSFDIAKQGYVHLLPIQDKRSKAPGDSKDMVQARSRLLNSGLYKSVSDKVNTLVTHYLDSSEHADLLVLDAGCGEGYYLTQLQRSLTASHCSSLVSLAGIDISKPAVLQAAKREKNDIAWAVATNRNLPVMENSLDLILCMFGFPVFAEFASKLKAGGAVLLAEAGPDHLIEIRRLIYDEIRPHTFPAHTQAGEQGLTLANQESLSYVSEPLDNMQLRDLVSMTPHFFKSKREKREQLLAMSNIRLTIDVHFRLFKKSR